MGTGDTGQNRVLYAESSERRHTAARVHWTRRNAGHVAGPVCACVRSLICWTEDSADNVAIPVHEQGTEIKTQVKGGTHPSVALCNIIVKIIIP